MRTATQQTVPKFIFFEQAPDPESIVVLNTQKHTNAILGFDS